jgi:hypothetical protein
VGEYVTHDAATYRSEEAERSSRERFEAVVQSLGRAGDALDPLSCWLLLRCQDQKPISQENLAKRLGVPGEKLRPVIESLTQKELVTGTSPSDGQPGGLLLLTLLGGRHSTN